MPGVFDNAGFERARKGTLERYDGSRFQTPRSNGFFICIAVNELPPTKRYVQQHISIPNHTLIIELAMTAVLRTPSFQENELRLGGTISRGTSTPQHEAHSR